MSPEISSKRQVQFVLATLNQPMIFNLMLIHTPSLISWWESEPGDNTKMTWKVLLHNSRKSEPAGIQKHPPFRHQEGTQTLLVRLEQLSRLTLPSLKSSKRVLSSNERLVNNWNWEFKTNCITRRERSQTIWSPQTQRMWCSETKLQTSMRLWEFLRKIMNGC